MVDAAILNLAGLGLDAVGFSILAIEYVRAFRNEKDMLFKSIEANVTGAFLGFEGDIEQQTREAFAKARVPLDRRYYMFVFGALSVVFGFALQFFSAWMLL